MPDTLEHLKKDAERLHAIVQQITPYGKEARTHVRKAYSSYRDLCLKVCEIMNWDLESEYGASLNRINKDLAADTGKKFQDAIDIISSNLGAIIRIEESWKLSPPNPEDS